MAAAETTAVAVATPNVFSDSTAGLPTNSSSVTSAWLQPTAVAEKEQQQPPSSPLVLSSAKPRRKVEIIRKPKKSTSNNLEKIKVQQQQQQKQKQQQQRWQRREQKQQLAGRNHTIVNIVKCSSNDDPGFDANDPIASARHKAIRQALLMGASPPPPPPAAAAAAAAAASAAAEDESGSKGDGDGDANFGFGVGLGHHHHHARETMATRGGGGVADVSGHGFSNVSNQDNVLASIIMEQVS
jgi:hypothetical protein